MTAYTTSTKVYNMSGLTSTDVSSTKVDEFIGYAQDLIDEKSDYEISDTAPSSHIEYFDIDDVSDYFEPVYLSGKTLNNNAYYYLRVKNIPLITITEIMVVDYTGADVQEITSDYYKLREDDGEIYVSKAFIFQGIKRVKTTYTSGTTTVSAMISQLTTVIASITALGSLVGATYNDITRGRIGDMDYGVGEQYINLKNAISELKKTENILWDSIPLKQNYFDV